MEASLAATGMLDVLATKAVLFMMLSVFPSTSMVSCKSGVHHCQRIHHNEPGQTDCGDLHF